MKTTVIDYYNLDEESRTEAIEGAAASLKRGQLVAFPTETVYGLGADGLNAEAVRKIFAAKGRPADNPLILHVASEEMLDEIVTAVSDQTATLMDAFWPGPLTVVLPRSAKVPAVACAGLDTVAVRWPSNEIAQRLIIACGTPVAAPSANISGRPSPTAAGAVLEDIDGKVEYIIDGGNCSIGLESTVLDCSGICPVILRPGSVTAEMIETVLDTEIFAQHSSERPVAPGMKYRHYAPEAPLYLTDLENYAKTNDLIRTISTADKPSGFIGCSENCLLMPSDVITFPLAEKHDLPGAANNLFRALRYMDDKGAKVIYAEVWPETGIGAAIMNRLRKAAASSKII